MTNGIVVSVMNNLLTHPLGRMIPYGGFLLMLFLCRWLGVSGKTNGLVLGWFLLDLF